MSDGSFPLAAWGIELEGFPFHLDLQLLSTWHTQIFWLSSNLRK